MKPYEYRYQVRPFTMATCEACDHQFRQYGEPTWDEPLDRGGIWPESMRLRSASEHAEAATNLPPDAVGISMGRWYDQKFHPDYHVLARHLTGADFTLSPHLGAV